MPQRFFFSASPEGDVSCVHEPLEAYQTDHHWGRFEADAGAGTTVWLQGFARFVGFVMGDRADALDDEREDVLREAYLWMPTLGAWVYAWQHADSELWFLSVETATTRSLVE